MQSCEQPGVAREGRPLIPYVIVGYCSRPSALRGLPGVEGVDAKVLLRIRPSLLSVPRHAEQRAVVCVTLLRRSILIEEYMRQHLLVPGPTPKSLCDVDRRGSAAATGRANERACAEKARRRAGMQRVRPTSPSGLTSWLWAPRVAERTSTSLPQPHRPLTRLRRADDAPDSQASRSPFHKQKVTPRSLILTTPGPPQMVSTCELAGSEDTTVISVPRKGNAFE